MAPSKKQKEYPATSIRSLDHSTEFWSQTLDKACYILQIDLAPLWHGHCKPSDLSEAIGDTGDPRIDWALKWILRSLESIGETPNERSLQYKSWEFLYELMRRSSVARIAKTIRESKFVELVHRTFAWMGEQCAAGLDKEPKYLRRDSVISQASDEASRKRKRGQDALSFARDHFPNGGVDVLFTSVCAVLSHINHLINGGDESTGYAIEHLKHAAKFPPRAMADVLGNACYIANALVHCMSWLSWPEGSEHSHVREGWQASAFEPCVLPLFDMWDRCVSRVGSSNPQDAHLAFRKSCSVDALLLIHTCSQIEATGDLCNRLKRTLTNHVALPYRQHYFELSKAARSAQTDPEHAFVQDLSALLRRRRLTKHLRKKAADRKTRDHINDALLSILFTLGVRSHPRHSQSLREKENAWLEALFLDLIEVIKQMRIEGSFKEDRRVERRLARYMLGTCDKERVQLKSEIIRNIVENTSGLFDENDNPCIEWDLIGYCLSLDPDVFIVHHLPENGDGQRKLKSPEYLDRLSASLITHVPDELHIRQNISRSAVIGLMDGFLNARDLSGFLAIWEKQIAKALRWRKHLREERGPQCRPHVSVWEDDLVIYKATGRLRQLPTTQLKQHADKLLGNLREHRTLDKRIPSLIVLDALLQSVQSEEQVDMLNDTVGLLLAEVTKTLDVKGASTSQDLWRCWRILSTLQQTWSAVTAQVKSVAEVDQKAQIERVLKLLAELPQWQVNNARRNSSQADVPQGEVNLAISSVQPETMIPTPPQSPSNFEFDIAEDFSEIVIGNPSSNAAGVLQIGTEFSSQYYAFAFIISLVPLSLNVDVKQHFSAAVNSVLDTMQVLCRKIDDDAYGHHKHKYEESRGFVPGSAVLSIDALYIGCLLTLISDPILLNALNTKVQARLILQTYTLAAWVHREKEKGEDGTRSLGFEQPWHRLLAMLPEIEDRGFQQSIVEHICDRYIRASPAENPSVFQQFASDYLFALASVRRIHPRYLPKDLTTRIATQVCRLLLYYPHRIFHIFENHVTFLAALLPSLSDPVQPFVDAETEGRRWLEPSESRRNWISRLAGCLRDAAAHEISIMVVRSLGQVFRCITDYMLQHAEKNPGVKEYFKIFWLDVIRNNEAQDLEPVSAILKKAMIAEVLQTLYHDEADVLKNWHIMIKEIQHQRHDLMSRILFQSQGVSTGNTIRLTTQDLKEAGMRVALCTEVDCLRRCVDLLRMHPKFMGPHGVYEAVCSVLSRVIHTHDNLGPDSLTGLNQPEVCPPSYVATRIAAFEMALCKGDDGLISCILEMSKMLDEDGTSARGLPEGPHVPSLSLESTEERASFIGNINRSITTLNWNQRTDMLERIFHPKNSSLDESELHVVRAIILSDWKNIDSTTAAALSKIFISICEHLKTTEAAAFRSTILCFQCLAAFLTRHARTVSLYNISLLLSIITILSWRLPKPITTTQSAHLHTALVRLTTILLRSFRPQVARYHHILLPALQALLQNLFVPYPANSLSPLPTTTLAVSHAVAYARLLTLLCDPTPSSVAPPSRKKPQQNNGLVDQTRRAKSITGEHMQYLIASYCKYQLDGKLAADMKAAISPALWVVLDCIEQGTLRAMAESMDDAGRDVFRALYSEYSRAKEGRRR